MGFSLKLGELLVARGLITPEQLEDALFIQRQGGGRLGTNLIELGYVSDEDLARCLSEQLSIPYVRAEALENIAPEVIARVPRKLAEKYRTVPVRFHNGELYLCMADPQNFAKVDELKFALNTRLHLYVITEVTLNFALERYYGIRREVRLRDVSGGVRELVTPAPSPAYYERHSTQSLPVFGAASEPSSTVIEDLAVVMHEEDVQRAVFRYFTDVFEEVLILNTSEKRPLLVRAGSKTRAREVRGATVPLTEGGLLHGLLAKPQAQHQLNVTDGDVKRMCMALGFPLGNHAYIPIFDGTRPFYLVVGQGRDERYLVNNFPGIKTFVSKVSHALRIVALRRQIRAA
jgi:hypothetical protein